MADKVTVIVIHAFVILMAVILITATIALVHRYFSRRRQSLRMRVADDLSHEYLRLLVDEDTETIRLPQITGRASNSLMKEFLVRVARQIKGDMQMVVLKHYESLGFLEQDLRLLHSRFTGRRIKAMERLEVMATEKCLSVLLHTLRTDKLTMLRVRAAQTLYRLGYEEYEDFVRLLTMDSRLMMLVLADTLIHIGKPIVSHLTRFVEEHPDSQNAGLAVRIIGETGASSAVPSLIKFIESGKSEVRINAVRALTQCEGMNAAAPLASCLTDEHPIVRMMALRGLAVLGASQYEHVILERLTDDDSRVSREAAAALQQFGWTGENLPASQQRWFTLANRHRQIPVEELP